MAIYSTGCLPVIPLSPYATLSASNATADTSWLNIGENGNYYYIAYIKVNSVGGTSPTHSFKIVAADDDNGTNTITIVPSTPTSSANEIGQYTFNGVVEGKQYVKIDVTLGGTTPTINYDYVIKLFKL